MSKVYIIYENPDWMPPLLRELGRARIPYEEWFIHKGHFDLNVAPPKGVFLNRMSASSHTRGHHESVDFTRELIVWLESHGRRVINGSNAFVLEISKVRQYEALRLAGIRTPHTIAVAGDSDALKQAARKMLLPFITKHNRGGKGLGVYLFHSLEAFDNYVDSPQFDLPPDHITLLQAYIEPRELFITRVEIVDGEFLYAVKADVSHGFQLCPCEINREIRPVMDFSQSHETDEVFDRQNLFSLREGFNDPIIGQYIAFMQKNQIDIAGIEFIEDRLGNKFTYDINGTTNYAPSVEERYKLNGMAAIVQFLIREDKKRM